MFTKQTVRDINPKGKRLLVRVDYNVPLKGGVITDDFRIRQSLPTLKYLLDKDASLVLCSHLGRPGGRVTPELSLRPVAKRLGELLGKLVEFVDDCAGPLAAKAARALKPGQVLLLENTRFYPGEEASNAAFAKRLVALADIFVQDAFGVVHHPAVTVSEIPKYLPAVAGLLLEKEVDTITNVMAKPERPLAAIIGGAKIADKIDVINRFIELADFIAIGGAMANTFLLAEGTPVGDSLVDGSELPVARDILRRARAQAKERDFVFVLPRDGVVASKIDAHAPTRLVDWGSQVIADIESYPRRPAARASHVLAHEKILDIGPFSASFMAGALQLTETVVWNGTMGVAEEPGVQGPVGPYAHGTELLVDAMLGQFGHRPFSLVGGGDTVAYVESQGLTEAFDHVSTGGGASLELLAGRKLPGVEVLKDKAKK